MCLFFLWFVLVFLVFLLQPYQMEINHDSWFTTYCQHCSRHDPLLIYFIFKNNIMSTTNVLSVPRIKMQTAIPTYGPIPAGFRKDSVELVRFHSRMISTIWVDGKEYPNMNKI